MAGLAALCAAAALLLAVGVGGQTVPPATTFSTAYRAPSPPVGYGWGNDCYLNKIAKVIVTVQANDPVSSIDPTPVSILQSSLLGIPILALWLPYNLAAMCLRSYLLLAGLCCAVAQASRA